MARYPARWTVFCCSIPRADPIRAYNFFRACEVFGVKARLLPFEESADIATHLEVLRDLNDFDCVVTHNEIGEYGHEHHKQVYRYVAGQCRDKVVTIGYGKPADPRSVIINLDERELERKLTALRCYDHISPTDGKPKWQALIERYSPMFNLGIETYDRA